MAHAVGCARLSIPHTHHIAIPSLPAPLRAATHRHTQGRHASPHAAAAKAPARLHVDPRVCGDGGCSGGGDCSGDGGCSG
eukprot:6197207-Pleurochrysis_carterae.AAC.1